MSYKKINLNFVAKRPSFLHSFHILYNCEQGGQFLLQSRSKICKIWPDLPPSLSHSASTAQVLIFTNNFIRNCTKKLDRFKTKFVLCIISIRQAFWTSRRYICLVELTLGSISSIFNKQILLRFTLLIFGIQH